MPPTAHPVWTLIRMLRKTQPGSAASRPRELRDNAPRHRRPRDHSGTAGCGRADGATRRCSTSRAHPAVLTKRGLRAGSTWEPRGASGRVDQDGSTGRERLRRSCKISELPHEHSQRLVTTNGSFVYSRHEPTPIFRRLLINRRSMIWALRGSKFCR